MLQRLQGAALARYHLGRMTTCVALGAASATLLGCVARHPGFRAVVALMPGLAALVMIAQAVDRSLPGAAWVKGLLARPQGWRGHLLAMAWRIVT